MTKNRPTAVFTQEFGAEFEVERLAWLRRRFLWYSGFVLAITAFSTVFILAAALADLPLAATPGSSRAVLLISLLSGIATIALYGFAFVFVWRRRNGPAWPPTRLAYWLIVISGLITLVTAPVFTNPVADELTAVPPPRSGIIQVNPGVTPAPQANQPDVNQPDVNQPDAQAQPQADQPAPDARSDERRSAAEALDRKRKAAIQIALGGLGAVWSIFLTHILACLFLPWTAEESFKPLVPLITATAVIMALFTLRAFFIGAGSPALLIAGLGVVLGALVSGFPGAGVCWWRHNRFRERFTATTLRGRYAELRQELTNARQIHESLFPKPADSGWLTFRYLYEPMRQIGGDYLYARFDPLPAPNDAPRPFNLVLIDVTGHGIPAALTVNRLHGELDRIFAENPGCRPGRLLALLNSYVHHTLSNHSVFATALCVRVDPAADHGRGSLEYASGGHPPAFVRGADGSIEQLECTCYVLGASPPAEFAPDARTVPFRPGDSFIAYTDGAMESRDQSGRYLGVRGIQRLIASAAPDPQQGWPRTILDAVDQFRFGPIADDTLVVEITRPPGSPRPVSPHAAAAAAR